MDAVPVEPHVHCVLLPCSSGETWAVPLNSVAEVLVRGELLSGRLCWRGLELPVYPQAAADEQTGGIYAVMLGLGDLVGDYWAVNLQNRRLAYLLLTEADLAGLDEDGSIAADTLAVFALAGTSCLVPDLGALHAGLAAEPASPVG